MSRSKSRRSAAAAALTHANLRLHAARNSCGQTPDNSEESCGNSTTTAYSAVFAADDNNNNNNNDNDNDSSSFIRHRLKRKCSRNVSYTDDDASYPVEVTKKYKKRGRPRKKAAANLPTPDLQVGIAPSIAFRKDIGVAELESYIKSRWGGLLNFDDKKNKRKRKRKTTTTTTTTTTTSRKKKKKSQAVELPLAVVEYNEALRDKGPELPEPIIDYNNNLGDESSNVSSSTATAAASEDTTTIVVVDRPDFAARLGELRAMLPALAARLQSYEMLAAAGDYVDCLIVLFYYLERREARISSSMMTMVEEMRRQDTVAAFDEKVRRGYDVYLTMMGQ